MFFQKFLVFLVVLYNANAYTLPSYIKVCSQSDPKVGDCIRDRMMELLPRFVKGNAALHVPRLAPFHLNEIVIEATKTLTLKLTDIDIFGIEKAEVTKIVTDLKDLQSNVYIKFPLLNVIGTYDVDGQIMVLPIKGHGPLNITVQNAEFHFQFTWGLDKRDGVNYAKFKESHLKYTTENTHFQFDNLFNGNKELGDQVNNFINENQKDLANDVAPAISDTIKSVVMGIFTSVADQVPYDQLFKP